MSDFIFSINATFPIFLTMLVGMFLRHVGAMDLVFTAQLNKFVFNVALPTLLFYDLARHDFIAVWDARFVGFCFAATLISIAAISLVARILIKDKGRRGEFIQGSYRSSAAILGIAFIQNIYGAGNEIMAPLMILGSVPLYNVAAVIILTISSPLHSEAEHQPLALLQKSLKEVIKNPIIVGIVAGFAWSLLRLPTPKIVFDTVHYVSVLATPLGLMAMGASFDIAKAQGELRVASVATAFKLLVLVAVFLPFGIALGFRDQQLVALLIMLGSATTVSCYIMALNMGHEGTLSSAIVMMTTLGCALTLTFWLWLLKLFGFIG